MQFTIIHDHAIYHTSRPRKALELQYPGSCMLSITLRKGVSIKVQSFRLSKEIVGRWNRAGKIMLNGRFLSDYWSIVNHDVDTSGGFRMRPHTLAIHLILEKIVR